MSYSEYVNQAYNRKYIDKEFFVEQQLYKIFTFDEFVENLPNVISLQDILDTNPNILIQYSSHDVICSRYITIFDIKEITNHKDFIRLHRNDGGACITEKNKNEYKLHENILINSLII
jgi:hypothetical protein